MACRIDYKENNTSEIRDKANKEVYGLPTFSDQTYEETVNKLAMYRNIVTTESIDNEKLKKGLYLDPSGKTMRYVWVDTKSLAFQNRVTDVTKTKFIKKKGLNTANVISDTPDNQLKKLLGTSLHKLTESLMNHFIYISNSEFIDKSRVKSDVDIKKVIENDKMLKSYFLDLDGNYIDSYYDFEKGIKNLLDEIIDLQKIKDSKGKVTILTEQFIPDWKKNTGGTIDLLALYSDNTADVLDYKSVHVEDKQLLDEKGNIATSNWLPDYKMEDFNTQIPILVNMLLKEGISKVNRARIIPIHAQLSFKSRNKIKPGEYLSDSPSKIEIATIDKEFLNPISLMPEDTGDEILNKSIDDSYVLLNNLMTRLDKLDPGSIKYNALKKRIGLLNKSISDIIIKKESDSLAKQFKELVDRYSNKYGKLYDIDNKTITVDGAEVINMKYMSIEKIQDTINDIKVFIGISSTLPSFLIENAKNANPEVIEAKIADIQKYNSRANAMLDYLKQKLIERALTEEEKSIMKDDKQIGVINSLFNRFSELPNTVINKAHKLINKANNDSRLQFKDFEKKLKNVSGELENWAQKNNLNPFMVYEKLVNKKTSNLHSEIKSEFYEKLDLALSKKDDSFLDKYLKLKENVNEIYEERKKEYKERHDIESEDSEEFKKWAKFNSPKELKYNAKQYWKYYEIDRSKLSNSDFTEEYLYIRSNKPLLNYYEFWKESMNSARRMYNMRNSYQSIPDNFVPWISKSMTESFFTNGIFDNKSYNEALLNHLSVNQELTVSGEVFNTIKGEIDPDTGKAKREIPKMFINPLRNANGEIDGTLKSFDLNASLLSFMYGAINYNSMNKIEPIIDSLKDIVAMQKINVVDDKGKIVKYLHSKTTATLFGEASPEVALLEKMIDYHMYGIKIREQGKFSKTVLKAKKFQQVKELALAPISSAANIMGAKLNTMFEGYKGYYYTKQMWLESNKARVNATKKYFGLAAFFEPYAGKSNFDKINQYKSNKVLRNLNYNTLLIGFRKGDEHIDEQVMYSVLQNYGIQDGKFVRIGNKEGIKSIIDSVEIKGENLIIPGLINEKGEINSELYSEIRSTLLNIIASQKGGLNDEDMNMVNMHLLGNLAMSFKNWMPALIKERFEGALDSNNLRFNNVTNTVTVSRYAAFISELELNKEDKGLMDWFYGVFNINTAKILSDIVTFGLYKYKINENRALVEFNEFKNKNRNNPKIQNYTFEDFLDYKQGQVKAGIVEFRTMLILLSILGLLGGDWDDDDKKDYKASWIGRQTYKLVNRVRREVMSLVNPDDWTTTLKSSLPIINLVVDFKKLIENTIDETRDNLVFQDYKGLIDWEIDKNDRKQILYELHTWIPGYKAFDVMFEPFDVKNKEY